jgi:alkylated DNA repair dioxygenase AlkB
MKDFFELRESRRDASKDVYFDTYSAAVQHAKSSAEKQGYEVEEDDWFQQVTTGKGKPGRGKTTRHTLKLTKNGKPVRKGLAIQVYNRDTNRNTYELNYYIS